MKYPTAVHIFNQLEPDARIVTGNTKRYPPVQTFIDKFGEEKYLAMVEQDKADRARWERNHFEGDGI